MASGAATPITEPLSPPAFRSQGCCEWGESFRRSGNQAESNINHRTRGTRYRKDTEATDGDGSSVKDSVSPGRCLCRDAPDAVYPTGGPGAAPREGEREREKRGERAIPHQALPIQMSPPPREHRPHRQMESPGWVCWLLGGRETRAGILPSAQCLPPGWRPAKKCRMHKPKVLARRLAPQPCKATTVFKSMGKRMVRGVTCPSPPGSQL